MDYLSLRLFFLQKSNIFPLLVSEKMVMRWKEPVSESRAANVRGGRLRNVDLVMWTFNSGRTLEESLRSIDRAIPASRVCHRIMVDGGSRDNTVDLGIQHGWEVFRSDRGIWRQA